MAYSVLTQHAKDLSMAATITSDPISIQRALAAALTVAWTGTPTGTAKLQGSANGLNWDDITGLSQATGGAAGNATWDLAETGLSHVRVVYTRSSGDGALSIWSSQKE